LGAGAVAHGRAKVRVIENVEELTPEANLYFFCEMKFALERKVGL
jgi:hypothetical protein